MVFFIFHPRRSRLWSGRYRLPQDKAITTVALQCTNKSVALRKLQLIVEEKERESVGILAPKSARDAAQRPLSDHLEDFLQSKISTRDEKYLQGLKKRVLKLIADCGWKEAGRITPEAFDAWRAKGSLSAKTTNEYLTSTRTLLNWMVKRGSKGLSENPLNSLDMLPTAGVKIQPRRAFSPDELSRLVRLSGDRGVVYLVAAFTGLRRGELAQIRRSDLLLESAPPRIVARASTTKNGKQARMSLHPGVAEAVRALLGKRDIPASELVFADLLPKMNAFRADLERAGIQYLDADGFRADFHALRHTFCTMLQAADVSERCAMELMRHSDRNLTNTVYTDTRLLPLDEAILKLPSLAPCSQLSTHKKVSDSPAVSQRVTSLNSPEIAQVVAGVAVGHAQTGAVAVCHDDGENARCRVRTCDFLRVKQALYH